MFERITKSCIAAYIIIGAHLVECISTSQSRVRVLRRYTLVASYINSNLFITSMITDRIGRHEVLLLILNVIGLLNCPITSDNCK